MDQAHCSGCGAALAANAPWCTLCFTPVRVPEPVVAAPAAAPVAAPLVADPAPVRDAPAHPLYPPVTPRAAAEASERSWPCQACRQQVPMSADSCPSCGAAFLAAGPRPSLTLPVVGDLAARSKGQAYAIAAAIGIGAAVVLVALVALLGTVF